MTPDVACKSKLPGIHAQETGWQSGVRSCIMPGMPTHLVQELNVGTVHPHVHVYTLT